MDKQVDLVISVFNQLTYTQLCLASVLKHTKQHLYNLIVVDNGSLPSTRKYLNELFNNKQIDKIIRYDTNSPVAKVYNEAATGTAEYICFLHNDCIVTPDWLNNLVNHFQNNLAYEEEAAVLNPSTNYALEGACVVVPINRKFIQHKLPNKEKHTVAQIENVLQQTYSKSLEEVAKDFKDEKALIFTKELNSFCMLFRRKAFEHVGGFNEQFIQHGYEHKELYNRLVRRGYEAWLAGDVFVHHFGNITSDGPGFNLQETLIKHEQLYADIQIRQQEIKLNKVIELERQGPPQ
jgi:GT2 family glycosyltransferase